MVYKKKAVETSSWIPLVSLSIIIIQLLLIIIIEPTVDHELPTIGTTVDHEQTSATSLGEGKNQCFYR